ncbi:MAG: hypothetical protein AAFN70_16275, partial [Planctomycetota bacterium]
MMDALADRTSSGFKEDASALVDVLTDCELDLSNVESQVPAVARRLGVRGWLAIQLGCLRSHLRDGKDLVGIVNLLKSRGLAETNWKDAGEHLDRLRKQVERVFSKQTSFADDQGHPPKSGPSIQAWVIETIGNTVTIDSTSQHRWLDFWATALPIVSMTHA